MGKFISWDYERRGWSRYRGEDGAYYFTIPFWPAMIILVALSVFCLWTAWNIVHDEPRKRERPEGTSLHLAPWTA